MSNPDLNRQSLQDLLASAFAVQQSQIDPKSLSAFVEIQRLIARGELNDAGTMNVVVESARCVADADGVAVGILRGDQLVYRAGSGSAAADVDRAWTASLNAPADSIRNREILRVDNADEDSRIQSAVCQMLGAKAVLILAICTQRRLAGMLEVRFNEAHTFDETEIRTYRLMAGLIEDALDLAADLRDKRNVPSVGEAEKAGLPPAQMFVQEPSVQGASVRGSSGGGSFIQRSFFQRSFAKRSAAGLTGAVDLLSKRCENALRTVKESQLLTRSTLAAAAMTAMIARRARETARLRATSLKAGWVKTARPTSAWLESARSESVRFTDTLKTRWPETRWRATRWVKTSWFGSSRNLALAGTVVVLVLSCWGIYKSRGPAAPASLQSSSSRSSSRQASSSHSFSAQSSSLQPSSRQSASQPSEVTTASARTAASAEQMKPTAAKQKSKRVATPIPTQVASAASDSSAGTTGIRGRRVRVSANEVDYVRGDVTVRYFNYKPAVQRTPVGKTRVEHFGNDVTVRYFAPSSPQATSR